jgi:tetratricopeptide (TPR) repeat protein
MNGYTSSEVAKLLGLPAGRIRGLVRSGFLDPERGPRGELRFSFQDLVLLRTAKELTAQHVSPRRVRLALEKLRAELPQGRPLSAVSIIAEGGRVIVHDGRGRWNPESGQQLFSFAVSEIADKVAPLAERKAAQARDAAPALRAEDWFDLGCELEASSPEEARDAYRRAIELAPGHADAHTNLGRLLHEAGELEAAEAHYRQAIAAGAEGLTATFNLGVVLGDLGRAEEAVTTYQRVLAEDPDYADAHYNVARIYERLGRGVAAVRHLRIYRRLIKAR